MGKLMSVLEAIVHKFGRCVHCGRNAVIELTYGGGIRLVEVYCPGCETLAEIELDPPNEAEVRY